VSFNADLILLEMLLFSIRVFCLRDCVCWVFIKSCVCLVQEKSLHLFSVCLMYS